MSSEATKKAWETRRARAAAGGSGVSSAAIAAAAPAAIVSNARPARIQRAVERISPLTATARQELTAGQKAAATRHALEIARQEAEARKNGIEAPSPLADVELVQLWIDDAKIGCGERPFVVVEIAPKKVRLFSASVLQTIMIDRIDFDRHAKPYRTNAAKVAGIIQRNATGRDRLGLEYCPRDVKNALACLGATA